MGWRPTPCSNSSSRSSTRARRPAAAAAGATAGAAATCLLLALSSLSLAAAAPHTTTTRSHTSVVASKRTVTHRRSREPGKGWRQGSRLPEREFVYVYNMPPAFTAEIEAKPVQWHPEQYDFDQVIHKQLLKSPLRTTDPARAKLFFIPAYLGRHFNWFWQQYSREGDAWNIERECKPEHNTTECWGEKWNWAKEATSRLVGRALEHVKTQHPYWEKHNGADHFMVFSYDHARCDMALGLTREELGELFSIQSYGDLTSTNKGAEVPPSIQRNYAPYEWAGPRGWACYRPDADILVPMFYRADPEDVVSPLVRRENPVILRFGYRVGDGKNLVEHYGHRLRYELLEQWDVAPYTLERPQYAGPVSPEQTEAEMAASVFCVCPPGATQDTTRFWRALVKGCLPITFFRANDLPFARALRIPYQDFTVNLQPDDYDKLYPILTSLLTNPGRMRFMQEALERHQRHFLWEEGAWESGVFGNIARELSLRAAQLNSGEPSFVLS